MTREEARDMINRGKEGEVGGGRGRTELEGRRET